MRQHSQVLFNSISFITSSNFFRNIESCVQIDFSSYFLLPCKVVPGCLIYSNCTPVYRDVKFKPFLFHKSLNILFTTGNDRRLQQVHTSSTHTWYCTVGNDVYVIAIYQYQKVIILSRKDTSQRR